MGLHMETLAYLPCLAHWECLKVSCQKKVVFVAVAVEELHKLEEAEVSQEEGGEELAKEPLCLLGLIWASCFRNQTMD